MKIKTFVKELKMIINTYFFDQTALYKQPRVYIVDKQLNFYTLYIVAHYTG